MKMFFIYFLSLFLGSSKQLKNHICSDNGFYDEIKNQCICDQGYFMDDCSKEGIFLIDEFILQEDQQYYIYGYALNQKLRIYLDNKQDIYIKYWIISPTSEHGAFTQLLKNQENLIDLTSGQNTTIFIIYIEKANGNIQYTKSRILSDSHNDNHDHSSSDNKDSNNSSTGLIAGIIAPVVSIIFMVIIGIYCYKRIKRRRLEQQQLAQQQNYIKPKFSVQKVRQNEQVIPPRQIELQERSVPRQKTNTSKMSNISGIEECSICLQPLNKSIVSTPCNHKFHTGCIKEFLAYQKNCPLCRTELNDNQLQIVR